MEDIARLAANMLKRDLYKSGQIGRTEKNVFTFDGNTEGRLQFPFCPLYKISNKVPDISTLVKLTSNMGGVEYELSAEHCTIETSELGAIIQAEISGALVDVARIMNTAGTASEEYVGLYVISTEEGYLARIEFEDTITPMKPEYLPGVCLPVVVDLNKLGIMDKVQALIASGGGGTAITIEPNKLWEKVRNAQNIICRFATDEYTQSGSQSIPLTGYYHVPATRVDFIESGYDAWSIWFTCILRGYLARVTIAVDFSTAGSGEDGHIVYGNSTIVNLDLYKLTASSGNL